MSTQENLLKLMRNGKIMIAALDHRGSLKEELHPVHPESTTDAEILKWKRRMVDLYKNDVSGILVDPIYGRDIVDTTYPNGWMLSMEKTGYRGSTLARETEILPHWSVSQAKMMGASGVKLLLYYDPENRDLATKQLATARQLSEECQREGIVFLLEPLSYNIEESREQEVLKIVEEVQDIPMDILKVEYPGTRDACRKITEMVTVPWVLLSAGMKFDLYKEALHIAMSEGASGFAVGRAVWQEFGQYAGPEREKYFTEVALPRMKELVGIVENG